MTAFDAGYPRISPSGFISKITIGTLGFVIEPDLITFFNCVAWDSIGIPTEKIA
jgi:hypothetical protein